MKLCEGIHMPKDENNKKGLRPTVEVFWIEKVVENQLSKVFRLIYL